MTFINQEVQIDPPLKRLWGLISVGLVILILGGFALFSPATEQKNRPIHNKPTLTPETQPAFNREMLPQPDAPFVKPKHFRLMVENLAAASNTGPSKDAVMPSLRNEEDYFLFDATTATTTLLQATPLVAVSQDGQARLEGHVSVAMRGPYLIVSLTMDVSPTQPDISYTTDEVYYEERPSTD